MSFFDDAAEFMKNRTPVAGKNQEREEMIKKLRAEFENATRMEVERALDKLQEAREMPSDFREVVKKVRIWLED